MLEALGNLLCVPSQPSCWAGEGGGGLAATLVGCIWGS